MTTNPFPLSNAHKKMLEKDSAIEPILIKDRGYKTVTRSEAIQHGISPKQARDGLLIPIFTTQGTNSIDMLRPDIAIVYDDKKRGKLPDGTYPQKVLKYIWPKGIEPQIDCHPACYPKLKDTKTRIWITEGVKKGDALVSWGECAISLPCGVWGFKSKWQGILADLDHIAWKDREVFIVFDSDAQTKAEVAQARTRLVKVLSRRGAKVVVVPLPQTGNKMGVDDFFASGGTLAELLAFAELGKSLPLKTDFRGNGTDSSEYLKTLFDLGYTFKGNACNDRIEVNGKPINDGLRATIRTKMRDLGFVRQLSAIEDAYSAYAYSHQYHPVKDYLSSLKWNGQSNIANLAAYFTDTDNIFGRWLKIWLVLNVAKVFEGRQNYMLVLDSKQGLGKSFFVNYLGSPLPDYFIEAPINPDDKDNSIRLISKWLWEVSELGSTFRRSDREALKFFITQKTVTVRVPYARYDVIKPAMSSLLGTINNEAGFLTDPTGNRRFLVSELTSIDWKYTSIDVNQIWAEAYHEYKNGYNCQLTPDEADLQNAINNRYRIDSHVMGLFFKCFNYTIDPNNSNYNTWQSGTYILQILEAAGLRGNAKSNIMELAAGLKELGIEKAKKGNVSSYRGITIK